MNSKRSSIRVLGQRSIPSTFLFRSSNKSSDCIEDVQSKPPDKGSRISLSDFLNRKLQKTSGPPKSVKGKERPFSFPGSDADPLASTEGQNGDKKNENAELSCVLDVVLEQFKHTCKEKRDCIHSNADDVIDSGHEVVKIEDPTSSAVGGAIGSSRSLQIQDSRKRRNPFQCQGRSDKQFVGKRLLVLGSNPRPTRQGGKQQHHSSNENAHPPIFNHYANGCGWWDSNMEGVDNEEVGHNEVWEGVGTTTLGGLDWH